MEKSQNEILECGLVKNITTHLVLYKAKFQEDQTLFKYKELAETCLKAIRAFADTLDPRAGEQMRIKNDLRGYKCIVDYCKIGNRMSFQVLYKLSRIADHRPNLGSVGAVVCIITFLESQLSDNLNSSFSAEAIMSLCLFSREAVNRLRIRDAGGLEIILKLLVEIQYETYHAILLHALTQFVYDEESIAIMIKNGIVNVLVSRLKRMVLDNRLTTHEINDNNLISRKRTADNMLASSEIICNKVKHNRSSNSRYSLDLHSNEWSPRSISSACSSPSYSSPTPYDINNGTNDEDENYSPVCSDDEDRIDEDNIALHEEADSLNSYRSTNIGKDNSCTGENGEEFSKVDSMVGLTEIYLPHLWTLNLLTKLTFWNDPIEGLAHPTTIQALTAYIETSENFRAPSILNRILKNHVYFLPLLLQGFVFDVQLLKNAHDYLKILCNIAESGGAFGELSTILLRGQESHKLMVAVSVPFLLQSKDKLRILMADYSGLELILGLLTDEKHPLNENSILSVCQLAKALEIAPEKIERQSVPNNNQGDNSYSMNNNEEINSECDKTKRKDTVTFELDDGETIDVCRQLLCTKSDVFYAMLEGRFFEGRQNKVRLRNVSKEGFSMLCSSASGRLSNGKNDNNNYDSNIEALLDAVLLADKFLMFNESEKLTETSISRLSYDNLNRVWNWARSNSCRDLRRCCVKIFLTSKFSRSNRVSAFRDFAANQNFKEFLNDIKDIVTSELLIRQ